MSDFQCTECGATFSLPSHILDRYPGWTPRRCRDCRSGGAPPRTADRGDLLTPDEALATFPDGERSGVFTDGSCSPNPGPGGWSAVYVVDDHVVDERWGHADHSTNNRMELTALINGLDLVPSGTSATLYSDSNLVVRTINDWAAGWERRGWKRKTGPVENLDLVREAYAKSRARPDIEIRWVKAHSGDRWNEYADALANSWRRRS